MRLARFPFLSWQPPECIFQVEFRPLRFAKFARTGKDIKCKFKGNLCCRLARIAPNYAKKCTEFFRLGHRGETLFRTCDQRAAQTGSRIGRRQAASDCVAHDLSNSGFDPTRSLVATRNFDLTEQGKNLRCGHLGDRVSTNVRKDTLLKPGGLLRMSTNVELGCLSR